MAAEFPVSAKIDSKDIDKLIAALRRAGKEAGIAEDKIEDLEHEARNAGKNGSKGINEINNSLNNVGKQVTNVTKVLTGLIAFDKLKDFAGDVINVTAEFQKFQAVLVNTLGSKSQALLALTLIQKFASQTPFSVQELTASFVKLANQGFVPNREEIRKLGDLAASTGKQFDLLTEAIIDAQTGEFERLKEFGIRAKKEGDNVTFTFKGVETQTKFTSKAIREYILSLGDAEGVSGSMAAISQTLGGQISNLGDTWDQFLKTLGDGNSGVFKETIALLQTLVEDMTEFIKTREQLKEQDISEDIAAEVDAFKEYAKTFKSVSDARDKYIKGLERNIELDKEALAVELDNRRMSGGEKYDAEIKRLEDQIESQLRRIEAINDYVKAEEKAAKQAEESNKKTSEQLGLIGALEKQIKALEDAKKKAFSVSEIRLLNDEIEFLSLRLDRLKNNATDFGYAFNNILKDQYELIHSDFKPLYEKLANEAEQANERVLASLKKITDGYKAAQAAQDKIRREEQEAEKLHLDVKQEQNSFYFQSLNALSDEYFLRQQVQYNNDLLALTNARNLELQNAGENEEAKEQINKKFDERERQLKRQQAERERNQAIFSIAINTAQAAIATLARTPLPAGAPFLQLTLATGAIQAALVASRPLPKFKDGVFNLDGPGTSTSDSINAMLSKGESVVPAKQSQRFGFLLKPMIENPTLELKDVAKLIDNQIPMQLRGDLLNMRKPDTEKQELLNEIKGLRKGIENLQQVNIDVDEEGVSIWARKGEQWTKYVGKRYSA